MTPFGRSVGIGAAVLIIAAVALWAAVAGAPNSADAPALTQTYRNDAHRFSLQIPAGYTTSEVAAENAPMDFVFIDRANNSDDVPAQAGNIQITITPAPDSGSTLNVESVLPDYPYIADRRTEPFTIAPGVVGFSVFGDRNNPDTPNQIWFEYGGSLYQIVGYGNAVDDLVPIVRTLDLF